MNPRVLRGTAVAAGLIGLLALAPTAYAQNYAPQPFWLGQPNSAGPEQAYNAAPYGAPNGPVFYGPDASGPYDTSPARPYWLGNPTAGGPAQ
jgi:hypothetical protein